MSVELAMFIAVSALAIAGGIGVVIASNVVYAALFLLLSLLAVAGIYILIFSPFLALVQVLIYGGAIIVVVLFSLMLTRQSGEAGDLDAKHKPIAAIAGLGMMGALIAAAVTTAWPDDVVTEPVGFRELGAELFHPLGRALRDRLPPPPRGAHRRHRARPPRRRRALSREHGRRRPLRRLPLRRRGVIELPHVLVVSAVLFSLGVFGVLARRNAIMILLALELMLNAVNINLVAFAVYLDPNLIVGVIFAIFVITVAAAEVGLALAIVLRLYRSRSSVNIDEVNLMRW